MGRRTPVWLSFLLGGMVFAVGCGGPPAALSPMQKGLRAYERGHTEAAVAAFRQAVAKEPKNLVAKTNLALTLQDMGRHEEALALYEELIR
ncbi:MAG: tetratricopeptide repeat protein, partial [bacterium]